MPCHLINAAVNLPASKNPELRGRRADFFVFIQDFCGSPLVDYCETVRMQERDPNLDLGDEASDYVNVPDGGHIENLGVYELLWRKCRHIVSIDYGGGQTGYLLYIKSSLTGNESDYVRAYRQRNPTFPHKTTADQFFSEAQFEAYRALGEHIGDDLFQAELIGRRDSISLTQWFDAMRRTLSAP